MSTIAENIATVEARIDRACEAAGRARDEVRLLPVSKTHPMSAVREAQACGYGLFGENKVQEVVSKSAELQPDDAIAFSVIGHLQTNKAKLVAELASEFQALDSLKLARELDKRLVALDKRLPVLIQVNSSREPQKSGVLPEDVVELVESLAECTNLDIRGLMTVAVKGTDDEVAACFQTMRDLQAQLRATDALGSAWDELSMGMSGDLHLAIAHGSTCVRVGTAIFGARDYGTVA